MKIGALGLILVCFQFHIHLAASKDQYNISYSIEIETRPLNDTHLSNQPQQIEPIFVNTTESSLDNSKTSSVADLFSSEDTDQFQNKNSVTGSQFLQDQITEQYNPGRILNPFIFYEDPYYKIPTRVLKHVHVSIQGANGSEGYASKPDVVNQVFHPKRYQFLHASPQMQNSFNIDSGKLPERKKQKEKNIFEQQWWLNERKRNKYFQPNDGFGKGKQVHVDILKQRQKRQTFQPGELQIQQGDKYVTTKQKWWLNQRKKNQQCFQPSNGLGRGKQVQVDINKKRNRKHKKRPWFDLRKFQMKIRPKKRYVNQLKKKFRERQKIRNKLRHYKYCELNPSKGEPPSYLPIPDQEKNEQLQENQLGNQFPIDTKQNQFENIQERKKKKKSWLGKIKINLLRNKKKNRILISIEDRQLSNRQLNKMKLNDAIEKSKQNESQPSIQKLSRGKHQRVHKQTIQDLRRLERTLKRRDRKYKQGYLQTAKRLQRQKNLDKKNKRRNYNYRQLNKNNHLTANMQTIQNLRTLERKLKQRQRKYERSQLQAAKIWQRKQNLDKENRRRDRIRNVVRIRRSDDGKERRYLERETLEGTNQKLNSERRYFPKGRTKPQNCIRKRESKSGRTEFLELGDNGKVLLWKGNRQSNQRQGKQNQKTTTRFDENSKQRFESLDSHRQLNLPGRKSIFQQAFQDNPSRFYLLSDGDISGISDSEARRRYNYHSSPNVEEDKSHVSQMRQNLKTNNEQSFQTKEKNSSGKKVSLSFLTYKKELKNAIQQKVLLEQLLKQMTQKRDNH